MKFANKQSKGTSAFNIIPYFIPAAVVVSCTILIPFCYAIYLSLHKWNLKYPAKPFIGAKNYIYFLESSKFWNSFMVTVYFSFLAVAVTIVLGFLIALVLNQNFKGRFALRAMLLVPWAVPEIANGILWKWILNPHYGLLNRFLSNVGLIDDYQSWLQSMPSALIFLVIAYSWTHVPLAALIILAGFQTIPGSVLEAAKMDGASRARTLFSVIIPLIKSTLLVLIIFESIIALKVFDIIYVLTGGGPGNSTSVLGWQIYTRTFGNLDFGRGSALAMILGVITMLFAVFYFFASAKSKKGES